MDETDELMDELIGRMFYDPAREALEQLTLLISIT